MALPTGYKRLEYIQSSGTQAINTGFIPNQLTRVVCRAVLTPGGNTNFLFGARKSTSVDAFYIVYSTSGYYRQGYGTQQLNFDAALNATTPLIFDANGRFATIIKDAATTTQSGTASTFTAPNSLYLFACNTNGTIAYSTSITMYSCQIYDNGTLVRNYIPCKNASGTIGLYDEVNNVFYTNAGTGAFIAGSEVLADYRVVDTNQLDNAILASANAIRAKAETSDRIEWNPSTGFASAINAISAGVQIATGSFTPKENGYISSYPQTITGLKFKPSRVMIYTSRGYPDGVILLDTETNYILRRWDEYDEWYDEDTEEWYEEWYDYVEGDSMQS